MSDPILTDLQAAQTSIGAALAAYTTAPSLSANGAILSGQLQGALANALPGAVLVLDPTCVEPNPVTLTKPVTLVSRGAASLLGGVQIQATDCQIVGPLVLKNSALMDVVVISADYATLLGCSVLGDPANGTKRGIAANARGIVLRGLTIDDIFSTSQDSQAVCGWDNCINLLIDSCYLSAAGETVMIGGADPASQARQPQNVVIRNSTLTKKLAWKTNGASVKDCLEIKDCLGMLVENCVLENVWAMAQEGYLLMLTPRNQGGTAPYSTISDIVIRNCTGGYAAALCNILGTDDEQPSGRATRLTIQGNTFADIDPSVWANPVTGDWGAAKGFESGAGPANVVIDSNTITGGHIGSQVYFYNCASPKCAAFQLTNNHWPVSTYGVFGDGGPVGSGIVPYCDAASTMSGNVEG